MAEQAKLKKILKNIIDTKSELKDSPAALDGAKRIHLKDHKTKQKKQELSMETDQQLSVEKKPKVQSAIQKDSPDPSKPKKKHSLKSINKALPKAKATASRVNMTTQTHNWSQDVLKVVEARKFQMMSKAGADQGVTSPLQMHLIRSESLRIAQEKIVDLEEELHKLRLTNESLVSASEVLKEKNDLLQSNVEELKHLLKEEKSDFKDEKEIILSTLEEAKTQINKLKNKKQELEKRLSRDLHGIHARENSLESRIEILKMENSVLQREKDKKIIDLKKQIQKIKANLDGVHKKNQDLQTSNNKLQESARRTVSSLRATIYNLEGVSSKNEETIVTEITEEK